VYAQLVDDSRGLVLGNHVTPIPVTLQLVASAVEYQALWSSGELNVSSMKLSLPTADAAAITQTSASQLVA
jgi:ABC-2 type transport system ATP-binding protein